MIIKTSASGEKDARSIEVEFEFGEDLQAATKLFDPKVIFEDFVASEKISIQGLVRRMLKAGKTDAEIKEAVKAYIPGVTVKRGKSQYEKTVDSFAKLSVEEKKELLAKLKKGDL